MSVVESRAAIRLREDIGVQLRQNTRPVLVDCLGGTRIVAEDRWTWEFLKALDGAADAGEVLTRLEGAGLAGDVGLADIEEFLSSEGAQWLDRDLEARAAAARAERERTSLARLGELVDFARESVPFYQRTYADGPRDISDGADLARLPPLTKDDLRAEFPTGLLAEGFKYGSLIRNGEAEVLYSSGTTMDGDRAPSLHLTSEDEANYDSPFGIYTATEPQARFSTPRCTGRECYIQQQSKEDRTFGTNLILNSSANPMFMTDDALRDVARELAEWQPVVLAGNPWYLAVLLRFLAREGVALPASIVAVLFGTEFVPAPVQRYVNDRVGLVPFDNYSASEVGNIANTCPLGVYHVFDTVHVEVVRGDRPAAPGELGEILVSTLNRRAMPMLRYRTGDLGIALAGCRCGLPQPALELHGRISECLVNDGIFATPRSIDQAAAPIDGLLFYRVRQDEDGPVAVEVIPRPDTDRQAGEIAAEFGAALAELGFPVAEVKDVERMHTRESMKFSTVISSVQDRNERVLDSLR